MVIDTENKVVTNDVNFTIQHIYLNRSIDIGNLNTHFRCDFSHQIDFRIPSEKLLHMVYQM